MVKTRFSYSPQFDYLDFWNKLLDAGFLDAVDYGYPANNVIVSRDPAATLWILANLPPGLEVLDG